MLAIQCIRSGVRNQSILLHFTFILSGHWQRCHPILPWLSYLNSMNGWAHFHLHRSGCQRITLSLVKFTIDFLHPEWIFWTNLPVLIPIQYRFRHRSQWLFNWVIIILSGRGTIDPMQVLNSIIIHFYSDFLWLNLFDAFENLYFCSLFGVFFSGLKKVNQEHHH